MTEPGNPVEEEKPAHAGLTDTAHRIWLAGLGAVAVAQETGGRLFADLVKRGQEFEEQGRLKPPDVAEAWRKATDRAKDAVQHLGKGVDDSVASALHRLGVPTREEIAALTRRVEDLTARVEKLGPQDPPRE